jgi:hypothetical protein
VIRGPRLELGVAPDLPGEGRGGEGDNPDAV